MRIEVGVLTSYEGPRILSVEELHDDVDSDPTDGDEGVPAT